MGRGEQAPFRDSEGSLLPKFDEDWTPGVSAAFASNCFSRCKTRVCELAIQAGSQVEGELTFI
jgi:hypothetical protein